MSCVRLRSSHLVYALFLGLLPLLSGCVGLGGLGTERMSPEQLRELAKVKDAHVLCTKANTPYGNITNVYVNLDKGVVMEGTLNVEEGCKTTITNQRAK